ncbi:MAG: flagellar biosynthetic protein FliO [Candidatus Sericytochromatia bacterium]
MASPTPVPEEQMPLTTEMTQQPLPQKEFQFDYAGYLWNMAFLIILLGILGYVLVRLKNRDGGGLKLPQVPLLNLSSGQGQASEIEVIERKVLEPRKILYLVRIFDNQYWLIGTTDTQIEALGQVAPPGSQPSGAGAVAKPFSDYLDSP